MKTTRREFLAAAAAAPVLSPILLGTQDKSGTKPPVLGSGAHTYEAIHDWGELPARIKWGNTHGVVEDSQGNIYVHHTVHATSDSADSMVVFDKKGKFIRSWGKEFRGVAHGLHIRKEGRDEFLYLTVNAANPKMTPQPEMQAVVIKTTPKGEIVWKIQGPPDIEAYRPGRGRRAEALQPDQRRHRAQRRRLRRRRLRLVLREPVQQQGGVHPHVRRPRIRSRKARRAARHLDGHALGQADARRRGPPEQSPAALHHGRPARGLRPRVQAARATSTSTRARSWFRICTAGSR